MDKVNREDIMNIPKEYYSISEPKLLISDSIKAELEKQSMSIRTLANNIGMQHPQIIRITSCENYTVDTLLRVLDGLSMEIEVKRRGEC